MNPVLKVSKSMLFVLYHITRSEKNGDTDKLRPHNFVSLILA